MVYQVRTAIYWRRKIWWRDQWRNSDPHACFNFVVAPSRSWSKRSLVWMYVLSTNQTQNRGLERHCRDPGIDRTTVVRDSEKRKICGIWPLLGKKSWHGMRYWERKRFSGWRESRGIVVERSGSAVWGPSFQTQKNMAVRSAKCGRKYCLEFSITWGRQKNFQMTVPFMYNFRRLCNKFLTIFWSFILHILLLRLGYFSYCSKKET